MSCTYAKGAAVESKLEMQTARQWAKLTHCHGLIYLGIRPEFPTLARFGQTAALCFLGVCLTLFTNIWI